MDACLPIKTCMNYFVARIVNAFSVCLHTDVGEHLLEMTFKPYNRSRFSSRSRFLSKKIIYMLIASVQCPVMTKIFKRYAGETDLHFCGQSLLHGMMNVVNRNM